MPDALSPPCLTTNVRPLKLARMKNVELTSSETDRKVLRLFSFSCRQAISVCCWFFGAFVIYLFSVGLVQGALHRSGPPLWANIYSDPGLRVVGVLPRPIPDAFVSYAMWWDKVLHRK